MKTTIKFCLTAAAAAVLLQLPLAPAMASGGPSGPNVTYPVQGHIGEVIVNPYKVAPLTAVIRNGGYEITDASVKIVPKNNGVTIAYKVSDQQLKTHAGIPVFGLYPDYMNTVEVTYTRISRASPKSSRNRTASMRRPSTPLLPACPTRSSRLTSKC